jgi:hypothetical protein
MGGLVGEEVMDMEDKQVTPANELGALSHNKGID